ncbi:MAG: O-succinylbenzoate synthase [Polyangiaceae bacterium]|nr:O-succinylbenzoate synthase [Polyangiaceae bacterium]
MQIRGGAAIPSFVGDRPYVRVGIRDERKTLGIGEATPWPAEFADVVANMATAIGNALPELGRLDLEELPPLEAVSHALKPAEAFLGRWRTARFALETALLDAVAQRLELSLAACLSSFSGHEQVPCNALLDAATDDLPVRAAALKALGFKALKVKLRARDAAGFDREVAALRELRKVWSDELRLDPNGMWTLVEAREKLERLSEFAPRYVEQPVAAEELGELGKTATPWAADESLLVPGLPDRLARDGTCAAFILKPALLGGFARALELANMAASAGFAAITTHALDGPVGIAAAVEFARALPEQPPACGLAAHDGLSRYTALASPHHVCPAYVTRAALPGLGFTEEERRRWLGMA